MKLTFKRCVRDLPLYSSLLETGLFYLDLTCDVNKYMASNEKSPHCRLRLIDNPNISFLISRLTERAEWQSLSEGTIEAWYKTSFEVVFNHANDDLKMKLAFHFDLFKNNNNFPR